MQFITRTPSRQYFITIFIVVSALFFAFSAVIYHNFKQSKELNQWTLYNYEVIRQSRKILIYLIDMETGVRGYLITGKKDFLQPYTQSKKLVLQQIESFKALTKNDPSTQGTIDVWVHDIERYTTTLSNQVQYHKGKFMPQMERQKRQMDNLRNKLEGFIQTRLEDLNKKIKSSNEANNDFKYILAIGTALAIGGMLLATLVILSLMRRSQQAEAESEALQSRFKLVMDAVNDGLFDYDVLTGEIYYSPQYKAMLGYEDDEIENSLDWLHSIIHPDDHEATWKIYEKYSTGQLPAYRNSFRLRTKHEDWIWVLSRGVGIFDQDDKMIRLIGTHTDITEQKLREVELANLSKEMETFTYITSHDLRAPLVNLKGFSGELGRAINKIAPIIKEKHKAFSDKEFEVLKRAVDEDIPESLRFIHQSVDKMDSLTTAVLDLSRIGKREYRFEHVDVTAVVRRCLDTLAYEITQKNITVQCDALLDITSDALALEQIFSNILDNAVKYLDPERTAAITITSERTGTAVTYAVADTGRGIAPADNDKVFQIFRRARNSVNVRGLGLGMAFVQATVRRLGGSIWFTSVPDVGTTFFFTLPLSPRLKGLRP
ncbi:MAG: ATP-binding protein [Rickettsiales bacterium]